MLIGANIYANLNIVDLVYLFTNIAHAARSLYSNPHCLECAHHTEQANERLFVHPLLKCRRQQAQA